MKFKPCPYCNQPFGEIVNNDPKLITFENKTYHIDVHRTWAGMKWGKPTGYVLRHWCPWSKGALVRVIAKTMVELKTKWEELYV